MADHHDNELGGHEIDPTEAWGGDFDPFADAEEKRVLFAALDSFR